jgi:hypothetical protein
MITRIAFYDFDGTLFDSPTQEEGKKVYMEKMGKPWPYNGWWYAPESLDTNIFDYKSFPQITTQLQKDNNDPNTYTVLLTGRLQSQGDAIREILKQHNIYFDDYNFAKKPEEPKTERIISYLGKFPTVYDIVVYDDRNKEIVKFKELKDKLRIYNIDFDINQVDNGNVSLVENHINENFFINEGVNLEKIRNFANSLKNKGDVFMKTLNKLKITNNRQMKKLLLALLLSVAFTKDIDKSEKIIDELSTKLINANINSIDDLLKKTKELALQDNTTFNYVKEILPNDVQFIEPMEKNDALRMKLIDGVFKLDHSLISDLAKINKRRFTSKYVDRYNQFDDLIENSLEKLKEEGESPNMSLIKAIMMVETGMIPRENPKGFHGFPQTKWKYVKPINRKFGTNFTMSDMYNPEKSAQFIHYYLKALEPISYVNSVDDLLASYNWGVGNYKKFLEGKKERMPSETKEYISLVKAMLNKIKPQEKS